MCRIILGGTGGQGIISLGKLLAIAGMNEDRSVSCYPLYGAEMRGGYAFSTVIISEDEIPSPITSAAEVGIFLEPFAYRYLNRMVLRGGMLILNSDLVRRRAEENRLVLALPADRLARKLGDHRCANMVVAGFLTRQAERLPRQFHPFPTLQSLKKSLPAVFPGKEQAVFLNERALLTGYQFADQKDRDPA